MKAHTPTPACRVSRCGATRSLLSFALAVCLWIPWQLASAATGYYTFFHAGIAGVINGQTYARLVLDNGPLGAWPVPQRFVVLSWDDNGGGGFIWTDGGVYFGVLPAGYAPKGIVGNAIALNTPDHSRCGWWDYARNVWPPMPVNTRSFAPSDCNLHAMTAGPVMVGRGVNSNGDAAPIELQCDPNPRINNCSMTFLPTLGGPGADGIAWSVNGNGVIVGESSIPNGPTRAYWYQAGSGINDYDSWHPNYNSFANAINNSNQAVGFIIPGPCPPSPLSCLNGQFLSHTTNSHYLPVAFSTNPRNTVPTGLGSLGGIDGTAQAINAYGTIVGWSLTGTGAQHAFMYANGVMTDLNSLNASGAQGWTMFEADAVNDEGQIVGRAINAQGQTEIFVLTP